MRMERAGHVYPPYRIKPDRALARQFMAGLGFDREPERVPPTYMIFLRGEQLGVDLFTDLDIPRQKALHGGQRYEWFEPLSWEDELAVTATVDKIAEKQGKRGPIWFADVTFEYRRTRDGKLVLRELTRLIRQS
jgi:MaoC dehydratase-like protein